MKTNETLWSAIRTHALELGFDDCGCAPALPLGEEETHMEAWLSEGKHATLSYLERNRSVRANPQQLFEGAQTVIVLVESYLTPVEQPVNSPPIGRYAWQRDYHVRLKERLKQLDHYIASLASGQNYQSRCFVDTAPVMEKVWAAKAGLGWIGKNTLFIHPRLGSYVNLGVLVCNLSLPSPTPITTDCGTCTACQKACPGKALETAASLDVAHCFSYQSTQRFETSNKMTLVGCDVCQQVCPWNKKALRKPHPSEAPWNSLYRWTYEEWLALDPSTFERLCKETSFYSLGLPFLQERVKTLKNTIFEPENET